MPAIMLFALSLFLQQPVVGSTYCPPGQVPVFRNGFAALYRAMAGDAPLVIGQPVTCEIGDPKGTGDTLQLTTTGLVYYRRATNTPTFTDGRYHIALEANGVYYWFGPSVDPPPDADMVHTIAPEDLRP